MDPYEMPSSEPAKINPMTGLETDQAIESPAQTGVHDGHMTCCGAEAKGQPVKYNETNKRMECIHCGYPYGPRH